MKKLVIGFLLLSTSILGIAFGFSFAFAEDNQTQPKTKKQQDADSSTARFMMRDDVGGTFQPRPKSDNPTEADFTWEALSHNGAASGADPIVGNSNVASFYDFRDGQPHPYFIIKK